MSEDLSFKRIARSFDSNMNALKNFNSNIGSFADKKDEEIINQFLSDIDNIFGKKVEETQGNDEIKEAELDEEALKKFQEKDPEKFNQFTEAVDSF